MKLLRTTLAVLLMSCCTTISAYYDFCADGIYYNILSDTEVEVTDGDEKYSGDITIPENVTYNNVTYSVTTIGDYAFSDCTGLTSIEIPNSVTTIGEGAFEYCEGLTSIEIPYSVTTIGNYAFWFCSGLTSIVVAEGNTKYDSREECNAIIETASNTLIVGCKNTTIPNSVTTIGDSAFGGCTGLTSIEIPNSVTTIGRSAFQSCYGLTNIEIPNSVTSIGNSLFQDCEGLTNIVVAEGNTKYDSREECNAIIETESNTLIVGCKNTTIPNSVTTIGKSAFYYCTGLTSIEIPNSVTTIGDGAFYTCIGLTSIEIPNSVTTIGNYAFSFCTGLTSIEIPNSVTSIGYEAFWFCTGLTSITSLIPAEKLFVPGNSAFDSCNNSNCILYVPAGAKETYAATEGWNEFTNIVELEDTNIDKVVSPNNSLYFDLNGRSVENPTRGIYIVNGKKILVK